MDLCRGVPSIAVNDAYLLAPWADVLYFADERWWHWHKDKEPYRAFAGLKVCIEPSCNFINEPRVFCLKNYGQVDGRGVSEKPDGLATGSAGGYQAINFAYLAGATRILLLGFDGDTGSKQTHFFGDHPIPTSKSWLQGLPYLMQKLNDVLKAKGVDIVNCSATSVFSCFRRGELSDEVLSKGLDRHSTRD